MGAMALQPAAKAIASEMDAERAPLLAALLACACVPAPEVSLGSDARDAGTAVDVAIVADVGTSRDAVPAMDGPVAPDVTDVPPADVVSAVTDVPEVADVPGVSDVLAPRDTGPAAPDADPFPPRPCMVTAQCAGACPPMVMGCVCAPTPMGVFCVPTCMATPDCPPHPGAPLVCRMGVCLP